MTNRKPLNETTYPISRHRFLELYHFCMQYREWKAELRYDTDGVQAIPPEGAGSEVDWTDSTADLAIRRMELKAKCDLVEQTAAETDPVLCNYILKAVTTEGISFSYLKMAMDIPCSKERYDHRRRKFYSLLSGKM